MPSPFPGMNPFLEQDDAWQDFHDSFLPEFRAALTPQIGPNFIVKIEEHIFVHEPSAGERLLIGFADVDVAHKNGSAATSVATATRAIQAPSRGRVPVVDREKHIFLEIRDRKNREVITVIELLSPANKRPGSQREQYLGKREENLESRAHFIEIDLLRGWARMPIEPVPDGDYCVMLSRVEDRPGVEIWPLHLRDRLPQIPVPLRAPTEDAVVDLQAILHRVYDAAGYSRYIYHSTPEPPLSPEDQAWAASFLGKSS